VTRVSKKLSSRRQARRARRRAGQVILGEVQWGFRKNEAGVLERVPMNRAQRRIDEARQRRYLTALDLRAKKRAVLAWWKDSLTATRDQFRAAMRRAIYG
jgi:hypothetical protein